MKSTKPAVVVTGASTGIGATTAHTLIARGFTVYGSVRREQDAAALRTAGVVPLIFDVTDAPAIARAAQQVANELAGENLAGLVNNAGIAVAGPLMHMPLSELRHQLEVNVVGVVAVTQAFLPLLGARKSGGSGKPGRIVNMSSVSGRIGSPLLGPYVASKHALEGLSDVWRRELMLYGIDLIVIQPGTVVTPIWDKAEQADRSQYARTDYVPMIERIAAYMTKAGREGLAPEVIADAVHRALTAKRPPTRMTLLPKRFMHWTLPRLLPERLLDKFVGKELGITRSG